MHITILPCASAGQDCWQDFREARWTECPRNEHLAEMQSALALPDKYAQFLARGADGRAAGFVEASLRTDYVNGTDSSPVAFLEGIYVAPSYRRQGVGRLLVAAVAAWARARGCSELASDAPLDKLVSHAMHTALGFEETERVVYFRKLLASS
jgi:aminoglycoside 6'-N-acetyltransferase I